RRLWPRAGSAPLSSLVLSAYLCLLVVLALQFVNPAFGHWFIIPVAACGTLIGADAVDWFRGRLDLFDPVGIIGLLGVHFFLLAPLLHVAWDRWMGYISPPPDWRPWLGYMAMLNLGGLLIYRATRGGTWSAARTPRRRTVWRLNRRLFPFILACGLLLTLALQLWVYRRYGGVLGYIRSFEAREGAFIGMGWVFMISESFPILAFFGYAIYAQSRGWARSWWAVALALLLFLVVKLFFGGLRGSRSNTIWGLFWAAGIVHLWLRPLNRKVIYAGLAFLVLFMYVYGFYKGAGLEGLSAVRDPAGRAAMEQRTGRTVESALLGDLGRADVQAFLLYRLRAYPAEYDFAWGRTYMGGLAILVPRSLWPERPPTKVKEGTELQYGRGTWHPDRWSSSRVYGLAGEAMLNFGPLAVPLAFVALGVIVGAVRRGYRRWSERDTRRLLLPLLINLCFVILVGDVGNIVFFLVKNGVVPALVVWLASHRHHVERLREASDVEEPKFPMRDVTRGAK
ncbi:MAG: hypothetical protein GX601_04515, partial [Anaerolineales bacterium]|nr:hypothetical protein [Anaerolineales bacterium]